MEKDPFKEYLRESEPDKAGKGYAWSTAIGLQAVDGLKPSKYLIDTAIQNIEGKITMKEAQSLIDSYYEERPVHLSDEDRTEEADKVSSRIAEILSETAFSFSPNEYISIHRKLFQGIYKHAGKIRDYNITKKEWVLDGATVLLSMTSLRKRILVIKVLQWMRLSTIWQSLFQDFGKSIFSEKAIQGQQQYFLSNISEHLAFLQPMIFLQKMRGILETHWFEPIILICKKVFTKPRSILKCSLEIYF